MPSTDEGRALTEAHRLAQARLGANTAGELADAWKIVDAGNLDRTGAAYLNRAVPIVEARRAASAGLAGRYVAGFRRAELGPNARPFPPRLATRVKPADIRKALDAAGPHAVASRIASGRSPLEAVRLSRNDAARVGHSLALAGGRETISATVAADPAAKGWARVGGGKTCAFCEMLISRGPVYSEDTVGFAAHPGCSCSAEPVYVEGAAWPSGAREAREHWDAATEGLGGKDAVLAFRRNVDTTARTAAREAAEKAAAKVAAAEAKDQALTAAARKWSVSVDELTAARPQVRELRRRIADDAARAQYESVRILERSEALTLQRPPRTGRGGEWDWLGQTDARERARLSRKWYTDTDTDDFVAGANSPDNIADRLRRDLGGDLVNMTDDQVLQDVWLHHTRVAESAGGLRRGKLPSDRAYSNQLDPDALAPSVTGDGFSVEKLLADDLDAAGHVANVWRNQATDDAYRALGRATSPTHGPSPFEMSYQAWHQEVRLLEEGLDDLADLPMTKADARARLDELMPADVDGPGYAYEDLYGSIVTHARSAGLDVPSTARIPWAD